MQYIQETDSFLASSKEEYNDTVTLVGFLKKLLYLKAKQSLRGRIIMSMFANRWK